MMNQNHPFHLVNYSPWPLTGSLGTMIMMLGTIQWFHFYNNSLMMIGTSIILITMYQWWRDISRESTMQGNHTFQVYRGLQFGMILFIVSEIFFFISFFWAYFHSSLTPNIELSMTWPPNNINAFNPFQIPLLNSIILISSGITVTWTHHSLMKNNFSQASQSLMITILLGAYFTILQAYEYMEAPFAMNDSVYGSTFFLATGFHGLHVIIGSIFLFVNYLRMNQHYFNKNHHFGFEAAAWYWHFVDVVWLYLFVSIYWWGYNYL
uniref:cytochrome c oxidase subunit III n=1 Tax=Oxyethira ecornuta TaxID=1401674 RepID=UPI0022DCE056|nr:cytochrome c oxidase subunit III [Oxyethira ecornuta]UZZ44239.1 cytochrome c oxidase subunit III [Oxyethira ecornuta]